MISPVHQYINRETVQPCKETLYADWVIRFLYSRAREDSSVLFKVLTSRRMSSLLGFLNFDLPLLPWMAKNFINNMGIDLSGCLDPPESFRTFRKVFERKIRYWETRPLPRKEGVIVSPSDSRVLPGSLARTSSLFVKEKFFDYQELLGEDKPAWLRAFQGGDYAIFRLTPDQYHYNHTPAAGRVVDFYEIPGIYHSSNPGAVITVAHPYSKNRRVVTILDSDVEKGTGVGFIAMIEVVALMIGDLLQAYSEHHYDDPRPISCGMFLNQGSPKSLFRPGSSTVILIFQKGRVEFCPDLIANRKSQIAQSRFSAAWEIPLVETNVKVRSPIAIAIQKKRRCSRPCMNSLF